jgi:hypothetical protein
VCCSFIGEAAGGVTEEEGGREMDTDFMIVEDSSDSEEEESVEVRQGGRESEGWGARGGKTGPRDHV